MATDLGLLRVRTLTLSGLKRLNQVQRYHSVDRLSGLQLEQPDGIGGSGTHDTIEGADIVTHT